MLEGMLRSRFAVHQFPCRIRHSPTIARDIARTHDRGRRACVAS
jgi:hypothetical protein